MNNNPIAIMLAEHDLIKKTEDIINDCEDLLINDTAAYVERVNDLIEFTI